MLESAYSNVIKEESKDNIRESSEQDHYKKGRNDQKSFNIDI